MHTSLRVALATAVIGLALGAPAQAVPITYTFSGTASGALFDATGAETDFTDQLFSIVLSADTSDILPNDPFYRIFNLGGSFSEGVFNATLSPGVAVVVNNDPAFDRVNFFNATFDNGLGFSGHPGLTGYDLSTSIGPLTIPDAVNAPAGFLNPTFGGGSFALEGGGSVEFTGNTSLTFTAQLQGGNVPEPAPLALLAAGLMALAFARRAGRASRTGSAA
jgi:hypothetical protein